MKIGDRVMSTPALDTERTHRGVIVAVESGRTIHGAWTLIDVQHDADCCHFDGYTVVPRGRVTRSAAFLWEREA